MQKGDLVICSNPFMIGIVAEIGYSANVADDAIDSTLVGVTPIVNPYRMHHLQGALWYVKSELRLYERKQNE